MSFRDALAALKPVAIRKYTLEGVFVNCGEPVLLDCRHAGFSTPGLTGAQLKAFNARRKTGSKDVSIETMEVNRKLDAKVFAEHVVVGWANVCEEGPGKPTPLSAGKVEEFLLAISEMRLDKFREFTDWASNADNFTDVPVGDPVDLGK